MLYLVGWRFDRPCFFLSLFMGMFLLLSALSLLSGCLPVKSAVDPDLVCVVPPGSENNSLIAFFLNLKRPDGPHLRLEITAVEISGGGIWLPVSFNSKQIDTKKIAGGQVSLGQTALNPGIYEKIRLTFSEEATITVGDQKSPLFLPESEVEIPFAVPFNLQKDSSESFFLSWDVEASLNGPKLQPLVIDLSAARLSPITANQIYVACPDINTVYAVRADKKWVDKSFFVSGRPTYIAIDDARQKLFVLCQDDADIKVIDLVSSALTDVINLPMTFRPIFMKVLDDLSYAFVIDDLGFLSKVDLQTGITVIRKRIGQQPNYVEYLPATRTVAVSSSRDGRIYLLDDESLEIKEQIIVNGRPAGIFKKDDFLYIAEEQANSITIFDGQLRIKVKSLFVGSVPRRVVGLGENIYVANSESGSLSLVRTQNKRVTQEIQLGKNVYEMAPSVKEQLLYVGKNANEDCGGSISVIDVTSNKVVGEIEIGSRPWGIVVAH